MAPEDSSEEKRVWTKRAPDQRQLFASDKWLAFLPYLSKPELDKCREVSEWTNWLIGKHSGGELKQRRQLYGLVIAPGPHFVPRCQMTPLDMGKWMEDEGEMEKIKAKAKELTGGIIYLYETEDMTVRISIASKEELRYFYLDVNNRLDDRDALLIARLMPHIISAKVAFCHTKLEINNNPELPADAPYGESYFNPAVFSLPSNADGSGGGPVKFITQRLCLIGGSLAGFSPQGMIKTAEQTVQCQVLFSTFDFPPALPYILRLVAVARPLNAPAWIDAHAMGARCLDEMINFFTQTLPGFESTVPRFRVTIRNTATWPESLPKESAINPREEQLAQRLYKFRRYNQETGEKLEIEVRGSFGIFGFWDILGMEGGGCLWDFSGMRKEDCLGVAEMVLLFRPNEADN